jgi:hypothetical protein
MQHKDSTAVAGILDVQTGNGFQATVPYPAQDPINEMDAAIARLRILYVALVGDSQMIATCDSLDASQIVNEVLDTLDPVRTFLAENEFRKVEKPFLECRRAWYAKAAGHKEGRDA